MTYEKGDDKECCILGNMKTRSKTRADGAAMKDQLREIMLRIFTLLNVKELVNASRVCKPWNQLARHPSLWQNIDLTRLNSSPSFNIRSRPNACNDNVSRRNIIHFLKYALSLSNGITTCFIFNYFIYLTDAQFIFVAQRTTNLKRLVLPHFGYLSKRGIDNAMRSWRDLKSITITSIVDHSHIFAAIRKYCKRIVEVKFIDNFDLNDAEALVKFTPNVKKLSVRNIMVSVKALVLVLTSLKHLELVNLCHSLLSDRLDDGHFEVYHFSDMDACFEESIMRKLIFYDRSRCLRCKYKEANKGVDKRPYEFFEDIWHEDEIPSLSH